MARFWEGTGLLHQMRGEWFDAVSCCVTRALPPAMGRLPLRGSSRNGFAIKSGPLTGLFGQLIVSFRLSR